MESKPFWQSKTVIGIALTVLGAVLAKWNLHVATDDATVNAVADVTGQAATLIGSALALWGRLTAKTTLTATKEA